LAEYGAIGAAFFFDLEINLFLVSLAIFDAIFLIFLLWAISKLETFEIV
jgi:hypothetical protein